MKQLMLVSTKKYLMNVDPIANANAEYAPVLDL